MRTSLLAVVAAVLLSGVPVSPAVSPVGRQGRPGDAPAPRVKPDGSRAMVHLAVLAGDDMKGRASGTAEYRRAAEYVAARFREYGLQPGGDNGSWFQEAAIEDVKEFALPIRLEISAPSRRVYFAGPERDFDPVVGTGSGVVTGKLAFAGYGIVSEVAGWNDYQGVDVKGRVVMILPGAPAGMSADEAGRWTLARRVRSAVERGAVGLVEMDLAASGQSLKTVVPALRSLETRGDCPGNFVVVRATRGFCDDAFYAVGKSWRQHASQMMRERSPRPLAIDTTVTIEVHATWESRTAPNVIGLVPGVDPLLKDEYIVLGGHLDHVGVGTDGFVYSGADDNASSVAAILEVVRVLQANHFKPRRTLVVAVWAGEELELDGSTWYTEHPPVPLEKTAVYLNADMVGAGDSDLWVGGLDEFSELFEIIRGGLDPGIAGRLHPRFQYRASDHASFLRKGVPGISLRTGGLLTSELDDEHPEYHLPGDRAEYVRPDLLQLAADYHYQVVTTLANTDRRLLDPMLYTRFIHRDALVADMHCDTIGRFVEGEDLTKDLPAGHIDIPKLKRGSVDLQVFAAYVAVPRNEIEKNTAARRAWDQIDAIHRLVAANPKDLALVLAPSDVDPLREENRTGVLIAIEGGYAIENDLNLLRAFHRSGVRLMTLTHWNRTDWADASGDARAELGGLTDFGEQVVREMNRLGMIVDVSHVHDETFWDVLRVTTRPIVASHSCARGLSNHFRNLSDEMLKALADNGGVVGINFAPSFLNAAVDKTTAVVDVKTVVDHIDHVVKVTGSADHVGLGSDYDGISTTPRGLENVGKLMAITEELKSRGFAETDIRKILGENFLRVFRGVRSRK